MRSRLKPISLARSAAVAAACAGALAGFAAPLAQAADAVASGAVDTNAAHAAQASRDTETLVFVRHGEKPPEGLGQLNCKGLNRALALPAVIAAKYGKPAAIYAPDPDEQKKDNGHSYYYVRPLATVEPTAIQFGLPIETPYGHSRIDSLESTLVDKKWRGRTVLVAWEHREIQDFVRRLVAAHGGSASDVPRWESADFDSVYVLRVDWSGSAPVMRFAHEHEGLDGRADDCPCAQLPAAQ